MCNPIQVSSKTPTVQKTKGAAVSRIVRFLKKEYSAKTVKQLKDDEIGTGHMLASRASYLGRAIMHLEDSAGTVYWSFYTSPLDRCTVIS